MPVYHEAHSLCSHKLFSEHYPQCLLLAQRLELVFKWRANQLTLHTTSRPLEASKMQTNNTWNPSEMSASTYTMLGMHVGSMFLYPQCLSYRAKATRSLIAKSH